MESRVAYNLPEEVFQGAMHTGAQEYAGSYHRHHNHKHPPAKEVPEYE